jgi:hypothetical protein
MVSGIKTAADPKPLDVDEYRAALIAGRMTYDQLDQAGRPWKLQGRTAASQWPPFKGRKIVAEHGCTKAMNMAEAEFIDIPRSTPASGTGEAGVTTGQYASTSMPTTLGTVAVNVIHHRSRPYVQAKCDRCKLSIGYDWNYWGFQRGDYWIYVEHGYECS